MFNLNLKRLVVLGTAIGCMALGAAPALASTDVCPANTSAYFTGTTVYLGQVALGQPLWSSQVTLHAYCGSDTAANWLQNVTLTGVYATSNGSVPDLEASADGTNFTALPLQMADGVPFPAVLLSMPANLQTDSSGNVTFTLYVQSTNPDYTFLAAPDFGPQLIGMQLDSGKGTATTSSGSTFNFHVGGFGDVYASTPELDSLALFGSGAMGMAGYALMRIRARRRAQ